MAVAGTVAGFSCSSDFGPRMKAPLIREIGTKLERQAYASGVDFGDWSSHVERHRAAIDAAATPESFAEALVDTLAEFGVSHVGLLAPEAARQRYSGRTVGLGLRSRPAEDGQLVLTVFEGGPAWEAGIRGGDVIVGVDGVELDPERPLEFRQGQEVRVSWRQNGETREAPIPIVEGPRASPASLRWLAGDVAVLSVPTFIDELYERDTIERLFAEARPAAAMILDMRSNPGGNSDNVRHLLGRVLPQGSPLFGDVYAEQAQEFVRQFPDREPEAASVVAWLGDDRYYRPIAASDGGSAYRGPLVVLIDERCGSGGELAPATLQDHGRARLIGTPTLGKVRISDHFRLRGGFVLRLPVGEFVTFKGRAIEGHPVVPDIELTPAETAQDAIVLEIALKALGLGRRE